MLELLKFHDPRFSTLLIGDISPLIAAPVALGVLAGAFIGSHLLMRLSDRALRVIFLPIMALIAIQMVLRGFGITI